MESDSDLNFIVFELSGTMIAIDMDQVASLTPVGSIARDEVVHFHKLIRCRREVSYKKPMAATIKGCEAVADAVTNIIIEEPATIVTASIDEILPMPDTLRRYNTALWGLIERDGAFTFIVDIQKLLKNQR